MRTRSLDATRALSSFLKAMNHRAPVEVYVEIGEEFVRPFEPAYQIIETSLPVWVLATNAFDALYDGWTSESHVFGRVLSVVFSDAIEESAFHVDEIVETFVVPTVRAKWRSLLQYTGLIEVRRHEDDWQWRLTDAGHGVHSSIALRTLLPPGGSS